MNADDLLSIHYSELKAFLSNEKHNLGECLDVIDAPTLFDIPLNDFVLANLEGGKIDAELLAEFTENLITEAADKVAEVINEA